MPVTPSRCPVPPDQLPINEYQDMNQSWFYSWGGRSLSGYIKPLVVLWCLSWIVTGPVAAASFSPGKALTPFLLWGAAGSLVLPILTLAQLYTGWFHVGQRLRREAVPYEESGWYDGQIWVKPEEVLNRDRLLMDYQVRPILRRVQKTFGILFGVLALLMLGTQLV
ncbi:CGLD27 family protein [Leptolyngbya sp. PCC 6406]|uniref:CGLD27 family protein n=1 Tax=Leptolyngbya sp. PCC 6406 TaxID=1173264 RepID=UPI0002ABAB22|nr:CGLD27 family protein [Leptolyngbya sp. PCC 6406]